MGLGLLSAASIGAAGNATSWGCCMNRGQDLAIAVGACILGFAAAPADARAKSAGQQTIVPMCVRSPEGRAALAPRLRAQPQVDVLAWTPASPMPAGAGVIRFGH